MKTLPKVKHIVIAVLIVGSLYLPVLSPVLAQEPTAEPASTPEPTSTDEAEVKDITWDELNYDDLRLTVGSSRALINFYVPGDQAFVPGSYTRLTVSHTGTQAEKLATLMVELNDHVLGVIPLTAENDDRGQIQLDILPEHFQTGRNKLRTTLRAGWDPCSRSDQPVEVVLHSEGLLHLEYEIIPTRLDLALYPVPFFELGFEPSVVYFILPDSPTPDDIAVAATVSAGLGRYSAGKIQVRSVTPSELTDEILDSHNLIVIGRPETNTFFSQLSLPLLPRGASSADDHGILQEITSPWNARKAVLVVTGQTYAGIFKAGAALNRQILFPGLKGPLAVIEELLDPPQNAQDVAEPLISDQTFENLGYQDTVIYGTQPTVERFNFSIPRSWQVSENPSLKLLFTHSGILSGTLSTLDVRLNKIPLGSILLDHSNSQDGLLEVELPNWLLESGNNYIEVLVDMSTVTDECLHWTSGQMWVVISRNSTLHLPHEPQSLMLDLADLFQPLTDEANLNDTYIALPETLSQTELDALLNLAVRLGAAAGGNYLALQVRLASDMDLGLKQTHHIVAIGQPSANSLVREVNDSLPQPFLPGGDEPSQIHNPAVIAIDPQRSIGYVQLAASPWNPDKALLVATGTDSTGVQAALNLLARSAGKLKGNLAMIEDEKLIMIDTRPLQASQSDDVTRIVHPDMAVLEALAERWW